jgi:prepilin-type N-terminal cleavage/methylation domain-containing protein
MDTEVKGTAQEPGRRGYTLIECVVALGVGSVMLLVGLQLYIHTERAIARQEVEAARLGTETDLLALLRRDVRRAALVAPESNASQLVLVGLKGSRVTYRITAEGVVRAGDTATTTLPEQTLAIRPQFDYPAAAGRRGSLVRVSWSAGPATRSLTLHLRNYGTG